jgi:arylsulfatase A-like enzyme/Tfp pilus assembly protein PilF
MLDSNRMSLSRPLLRLIALLFTSSAFAFTPKPNVILITMDTTRADRMGFLKSKLGLTPSLDALAAKSVVFIHAYSQAPLTTVSHATILSGTYPQYHQVADAGLPLPKDVPYAPEIFHAAGYRTAAFVGSVILDPVNGAAPGFDRAFDKYDAGFHSRAPGEDRYHSLSRRGGDVVNRALTWIRANSRTPTFVWIHLYDPHAPYDPPQPYASRYKAQPYDGEIAYSDFALGKLFTQLRLLGLYDKAVIVFTADHGESLGEHGERGHGVFLYDETIHVPLLLKEQQATGGKHVDARVELADILPTILDLAGIAIPKEVQGHSLTSMMKDLRSGEEGDRAAYSETDFPQRAFGWTPERALRTGKYLFIDAPRQELYDVSGGAAAERNLAASATAVTSTLAAQLSKFREDTRRSEVVPTADITPDQQAKLHALGYATSGKSVTSSQAVGADPKDKIELANLMTEGYFAMEEFHNEEAIAKFEAVIAKDNAISGAHAALGEAWMHLGQFPKAIPPLKRAVELQPDSSYARYQLATMLIQTGDLTGAEPELKTAAAASPQSPEIWYTLGFVYFNTGRVPDAEKQLRKALEIKPEYYEADLLLGFLLGSQKRVKEALPYLKTAARLQPNLPEPHEYLADAYMELGAKEKAAQESAIAMRMKSTK